MQLYHNTTMKMSKLLTTAYSTSFSMGIKAFAPKFREPIYAVYGFVRLADEIVDTFHGFDKKRMLADFRAETYKAINTGISTNPVLHAFQLVVNKYGIDREYIDAFLDSMEMDLYNTYYESNEYRNYIYGSAEVVGLMCLRVFVEGDKELFNQLLDPAKALGSAFQKVNFLRDIKSDIEERGRIYLPGINQYVDINDSKKKMLEEGIEKEFELALEGIRKLPAGVRMGVYTAYLYYVKLFEKIRKSEVKILMKKRVRVSNIRKFALLFKSILEVKILKTT